MSSASQPLIEKALAKIADHEAEIAKTQAFVNQVCEFDGREPMFKDIQAPGARSKSQSLTIGPDDFFNKPFATAVREILTMREQSGMTRAASIHEIHSALREGGYNFPFSDVEKQKHSLATSLGKNTVTFRKLPSGLFGLADWYGATAKPAAKRRAQPDEADDTDDVPDADLPGVGEDRDQRDEAAGSPASDSPAASVTPNSADEDGREVAHDNMSP